MPTTRLCPQCGQQLPALAADWLCPRCLLGQAGETAFDPAETAPRSSGTQHQDSRDGAGKSSTIHYFGDYELIEEIARGGMGVVYKARQASLNRIVAVKLLLFGKLAGEDFVRRFRTEAQAAAKLSHPNIVGIHEVGEHDGQHYFSMDYVEGGDLSDLASQQPLPPRRAAALLKTVAEAVQHAHQGNVLHRDLKPSNILLDPEGQPRVTDFGLAKLIGDYSDATAGADLTATGQVLGTPNYMSPEQAQGRRDLTTATDIYSLGALLYFLVTTRAPFAANSLQETLRQVHESEPVAPRLLNPALPPDLETICLKCLNKEPGRRYPSAGALAVDLGRFLADEPIHARPASVPEKVWRWGRRKPALAALVLALLVVGAAGLAGILWQWRQARASAVEERQHRQRAQVAERIANERLSAAYLAQARASRFSGHPGRRFSSLAALAQAAALPEASDLKDALRDEAIACLALSDVRVMRSQTNFPPDSTSVAFDRSLERYAVGWTSGGHISVRRLSDDQELLLLPPLTNSLRRVLGFSPDGRWLAARYAGSETRVWDLQRVQSVRVGPSIELYNGTYADFRPGGDEIAVADEKDAIHIFNLATGTPRTTISMPRGVRPRQVLYSPDGTRLAVVEQNRGAHVAILDSVSGRLLTSIHAPNVVRNFAWDPEGRRLALALWNRSFSLWDAQTGDQLKGSFRHNSDVDGVAFGPSGDLLLTTGWDGTRVWDYGTGECLVTIPGARQTVAVADDRRRFVRKFYHGGSFEVCEWVSDSPVRYFRSHEPERHYNSGEHVGAFSPDGQFLVLASCNKLGVFDSQQGRELASITIAGAQSVFFDYRTNIWIAGRHGCERWPLRARGGGAWTVGPPQFMEPAQAMGRAAVSADGKIIAVAESGSILLFDAESGLLKSQMPTPGAPILSVTMSGDGHWLATAPAHASFISLFDLRSQELAKKLMLPDGATLLVPAFCANRPQLVASGVQACSVWQTDDWSRLWTKPKTYSLPNAAFAPDGSVIAVREELGRVQLNDAEAGQLLARLTWPSGEHDDRMAFSADSRRLAIALAETPQAAVWDLPELRRELAALGFDWNQPAYAVKEPASSPAKIVLSVIDPRAGQKHRLRANAGPAIPSRPREAAATHVDLTAHYNLALTDSWFPSDPSFDNSFSAFPQGILPLAGTDFDVRGIVQLAGLGVKTRDYPQRVEGIRVDRVVRRLHVLHGTRRWVVSGETVGRYVIHYADGRRREWPIIYGQDVRDFWKARSEPEDTGEAWIGGNADALANGKAGIRVYKSTWSNPLSQIPIARIDFESELTMCEPFLIAVTTEP